MCKGLLAAAATGWGTGGTGRKVAPFRRVGAAVWGRSPKGVQAVPRQLGLQAIAWAASGFHSLRFSCVTRSHRGEAKDDFELQPLSGMAGPAPSALLCLHGRRRAEEGVVPLLQVLRIPPRPGCSTGTRCSYLKVGACRCLWPPLRQAAADPALSLPCPPQGSLCFAWPTGTCLTSESSALTPFPKESASALSKAKW